MLDKKSIFQVRGRVRMGTAVFQHLCSNASIFRQVYSEFSVRIGVRLMSRHYGYISLCSDVSMLQHMLPYTLILTSKIDIKMSEQRNVET